MWIYLIGASFRTQAVVGAIVKAYVEWFYRCERVNHDWLSASDSCFTLRVWRCRELSSCYFRISCWFLHSQLQKLVAHRVLGMLNLISHFAVLIKVLAKFLMVIAQLGTAIGKSILAFPPKLFWILLSAFTVKWFSFLLLYRKVYWHSTWKSFELPSYSHVFAVKVRESTVICFSSSPFIVFGNHFLGHGSRHGHKHSCRIVLLPSENALKPSNVRLTSLHLSHSDKSTILVRTPWLLR